MNEHKQLDDWINTKLSMSDTLKLIHESQVGQMKTAIVESSFNGDAWIVQSTIDEYGIESYVDMIFLDGRRLINKK